MEHLAKVDPLTGVLNRRAFFERLGTEFRRAQRYGWPMTVLMLDIDHFKALNDRYGHATGDVVLSVCAGHLSSNMRESDEIGRYGGEEFVIFLPERSLPDGAFVAEKLRQAVEELHIDSPDGTSGAVHVTISVGVACGPALDTPDAQSLMNHANAALYAAKRTGRNRISVSETGPAELVR